MNEIIEYAKQWDESAKYFYEKDYYLWMEQQISKYITILEVGCGTGYSTLTLAMKGHKVIAIDKNHECIVKSKKLLQEYGISEDKVTFLEGDIADKSFINKVQEQYVFDVVICWNIGTSWSKEMIQHYIPHMLEYGLTIQQIKENLESSYSELIIWNACAFATKVNVPVHLIDRGVEKVTSFNDTYYYLLKDEFNFKHICYNNLLGDSISKGGRMLSTKGIVNKEEIIIINFVSILLK